MENLDSKVVKEAGRFALMCSTLTTGHPYLALDFTWPSVGTVDYLLYSLRGKAELTPEEHNIVNIAASYLTFIAYKSWSFFPDDLKIRVEKRDNGDSVISASGGRFLSEGEKFEVNVSQVLFELLRSDNMSIKVFPDHTRILPPNHNFLSPFALGLFTGLTPYGVGRWNTLFPVEFEPYLISAKNFLSVSTADYYGRAFPEETLGQRAELYMADLILPACEYQEDFPAIRATTGFLTYLIQNKNDKEQIYNLAMNLLKVPDELISSTAFAVLTALTEEAPEPRLIAYAENFASYVYRLRPAVMLAREAFSLPVDWSQLSGVQLPEESRTLFEIEKELQLLPLLFMDYSSAINPEANSLVQELVWGHLPSSLSIIADDSELKKNDDVMLQQIFLEILSGQLEKAGESLKLFWKPRGESYSHPEKLLLLASLYHLKREDFAQAENFLAQAYKVARKASTSGTNGERSVIFEIGRNYITLLLEKGNLDLAQEIVQKLLSTNKFAVILRLALLSIYERKELHEEQRKLLENLLEYATSNRLVFDMLVEKNKPLLLRGSKSEVAAQ